MQTRRDHLQAYRFAVGRLSTALLTGDPGRGDQPGRRAALGTVLGTGTALLLCAGFGVYGLISPPVNDSWRAPGTIVMEQRTGTRYLYLGGTLRPVRNYASALLILGKGATLREVSTKDLGDTPHGAPVGIAAAPDSLPAPTALTGAVWTRCLAPTGLGTTGLGTTGLGTTGLGTTGLGTTGQGATGQGATGSGGGAERVDLAPAAHTTTLPADRQLLLTGPDGHRSLLWRGVLHPVPGAATLIALGLDGDQPHAAPADWLAALPQGTPLAAAPIADSGQPAAAVAGVPTVVGQLFRTGAAGAGHAYVMTSTGVAPIGPTEAALLAAAPGAPSAREVTAADLAAAPVSAAAAPGADLPEVLDATETATGTTALCLRQQADGTQLSTAVVEAAADDDPRPVRLPSNAGVLAVDQDQLAQRQSSPQTYLISDQGVAFPLGDTQAQAALGLGSATPVPLPAALLAVLPKGPVLSTAAARLTVQGG
ncbi:type VII secretion protein EccB [Kitasatospora sp. NBC_01287]|uniref:type VII secretion protein EccB n=1 Tax=Kitasatospora sp. NBC_01287 TaxID=2903573 RepID=UPI00224C7C28|nr:type VII secretion protein EccB [Kitasatospora sp. NBC_01287]MCX4744012.1 type VII secretion protein EccB [Kitasatospora sp. NBC_01287]